jgi:hypothetical protein
MSATTRRLIALGVAGLIAFGVIYLMNHLAASTTPRPTGVHESLKVALEAGQIPFSALLLVLGGWLVAAYLGGTVATRLSGERKPAQLFAVILTVAIFATQLDVDRWPARRATHRPRRRRREYHGPLPLRPPA